jgi:hypothetical protein
MSPLIAAVLIAWSSAQASQPKVLWQWSASQSMNAWQPNAEVRDITVGSGIAIFRTVGSDPILEYRPPLDIVASPWQAFEVRLKADRDGLIELFWTNTTEGRFGGFSQEKVTQIGVRGDGQWRTYRAFPFWQRAGRIVKLRFDPYSGTTFAIEFIRIIELPAPKSASSSARFPENAAVWQSLQGITAKAAPNGLEIAATEPGGFGLIPIKPADADTNPCISVRLSSARARRASIVFTGDGEFGLHETPIAIVPDGKPHTYNLDMLDHGAWKGNILAVGVRPPSSQDGSIVIQSVSVTDRPRGPADLRIEAFDAEEALPRAGMPMTLTARVTNMGGDPARNVTAQLALPAGVRWAASPGSQPSAIGPQPRLASLRFGQEHVWRWRVIVPKPGAFTFRLSVSASGKPAASIARPVQVTRRPDVPRSAYPPEPRPVRGKLDVGVYYFPGWRTPGQWAPITRFPERRPILGWYREGDPSVADWHIKWAVEHGITFFAYDWYWSAGARQLDHALHQGYFNARYRGSLKFCLLWANHNPDGTSSHEDFMNVVRYWIEHYFRRPEHYTIDGKPVMIIFTPHRFRADMGSQAVRRAFDAMRQECVQAGLKGLYIIACAGYDVAETVRLKEEGYDAVTAYNWPGLGMSGSERTAPYADLLEPHRRLWQRYADEGVLPIMTPVSGGWDSRPWHGDTAMVRSGRTPALFRRHLQDARAFVEANPGKALPVVLIEAWNELGEGSYIEPHREFGFGYLDAIRDVFTDAPRAHTDLTPQDVGHLVPQVDVYAAMGGVWDLSKDPMGWDSGMNLTDFAIRDGALRCVTTGTDPAFFGPPMQLPAADRTVLRLRMRLTASDGRPADDTAQVFWTTRGGSTSEAASVRFPVRIDGQWHDYRVSLAANVRWRGIITGLRLDPCNRGGVIVELAKVEVAR